MIIWEPLRPGLDKICRVAVVHNSTWLTTGISVEKRSESAQAFFVYQESCILLCRGDLASNYSGHCRTYGERKKLPLAGVARVIWNPLYPWDTRYQHTVHGRRALSLLWIDPSSWGQTPLICARKEHRGKGAGRRACMQQSAPQHHSGAHEARHTRYQDQME